MGQITTGTWGNRLTSKHEVPSAGRPNVVRGRMVEARGSLEFEGRVHSAGDASEPDTVVSGSLRTALSATSRQDHEQPLVVPHDGQA